jgi:hypothetical protein
MKKLFTLTLGLAFATFGYSQSQRMVLVEEATNASCPPCAAMNPDFHALLEANSDKVVSIMYQVWWPGFDPMYEDNTQDVDARVPYYTDITGAPTAVIDGSVPTNSVAGFNGPWPGAPAGFSQELIDDAWAIPASFDIEIDYTATPEGVNIDATATCTQDVSGNLTMIIAIIEKEIIWDSSPGTNGETEFYHVMKKMLPSATGLSLANSYSVGETIMTSQSWNDLSTVYNPDELAVVAFIQNVDTKEVLQAVMADDAVFSPFYTLDAATVSTVNLDPLCEPEVNPTVEIRNNGSEELTSVDINYDINGTTGTVNWTGSLGFWESEMVELGDITFSDGPDNTMEISLDNPNGTTDENVANNTIDLDVPVAPETTLGITVYIHTDAYAGETSWDIRNSAGDIVASESYEAGPGNGGTGGPDANTTHVHAVVLQDAFDCHSFTIYDSFGDGILPYGSTAGDLLGYEIVDGFGNDVISLVELADNGGVNFGDSNTNSMVTTDVLSVNESSLNSTLSVYPNPVSDNLNIAFELTETERITIDVMNLLGQVVLSKDLGTLSSGYSLQNLNVSNLNSGLYLVNINTKDSQVVRKITITE